MNSPKATKFFFIDEQGSLNNDQDWLLRGGFMIEVSDYLRLNREVRALNSSTFSSSGEVKWSEISSYIYLKKNGKGIGKNLEHLKSFSTESLERYLMSFFEIISRYDIHIVMNISHKPILCNFVRKQGSLVKMQLQNLMQRCQFEGQENNFITILVHENENTTQDDRVKKEVYKEIIESDSFIKEYDRIVDNLFIEFSNLNIGIQVADFIVGAISGTAREYSTSKKLYDAFLKSKVRTYRGEMIGGGILPIPNKKSHEKFSTELSSKFD